MKQMRIITKDSTGTAIRIERFTDIMEGINHLMGLILAAKDSHNIISIDWEDEEHQ